MALTRQNRGTGPGVYWEQAPVMQPSQGLRTGVPAFIGHQADGMKLGEVVVVRSSADFDALIRSPETADLSYWYLASAIRGFFENGGSRCLVTFLQDDDISSGLSRALEALDEYEECDLIAAPFLAAPDDAEGGTYQQKILQHCELSSRRFAILDFLPSCKPGLSAEGRNGAIYYPWVVIRCPSCQGSGRTDSNGCGICGSTGTLPVPPCGHVAGVYARTDRKLGFFCSPGNEALEGVLDLQSDAVVETLIDEWVNNLKALPGRGICVWGARTLSTDPAWRAIGVRRLFVTIRRWLERTMTHVVFEPGNPLLWIRITRELTAYLEQLFHVGALKGGSPTEAFYVKCDEETNPPEGRNAGELVVKIGLAPSVPGEFIVIRMVQSADGVTKTAAG